MVAKFKVLIIGLGQIGMGYDIDASPEELLVTHASSFAQSDNFEIVAGIDRDQEKQDRFSKRYDCSAYKSISELPDKDVDVVVIAVPTQYHFEVCNEVLDCMQPLAVLCEKPFTESSVEARIVAEKAGRKQIQFYVNYMRLCDPAVLRLKKQISSKEIVSPFKGVVWYSKGLFNSASHFVNLLQFWFGKVTSIEGMSSVVHRDEDSSPSFMLKFDQAEIVFMGLDERNYFHNSLELFSANGRILYQGGGKLVSRFGIDCDSLFSGYKVLSSEGDFYPDSFNFLQKGVTEHLANALESKSSSICDVETAIKTLEVLERVNKLYE
ncbi:Gfo/Idh/MocA family protein [Neptuniibacter sp. QD37_6]|uniref:Gfo/Idh/MocA family protein n=1 Tax=Neptuniibacter sp. QD37_6 TaxID=3398210 RepID=UPI0039F524D6